LTGASFFISTALLLTINLYQQERVLIAIFSQLLSLTGNERSA